MRDKLVKLHTLCPVISNRDASSRDAKHNAVMKRLNFMSESQLREMFPMSKLDILLKVSDKMTAYDGYVDVLVANLGIKVKT